GQGEAVIGQGRGEVEGDRAGGGLAGRRRGEVDDNAGDGDEAAVVPLDEDAARRLGDGQLEGVEQELGHARRQVADADDQGADQRRRALGLGDAGPLEAEQVEGREAADLDVGNLRTLRVDEEVEGDGRRHVAGQVLGRGRDVAQAVVRE